MDRVTGIITANYSTEGLGALTEERGIASLPFGGRYRLIDFPLSNLVNSGVDTVGVITPYKYRSLLDHVGAGKQWALDRKNGGLFLLPGTVFGASSLESRFLLRDISRNRVYLHRSPAQYVLITSANIVCNMDYSKLLEQHVESGADITMTYVEAQRDSRFLDKLQLEGNSVKGVSCGVKAGDPAFIDCFVIGREFLLKMMEWYAAIDHLDIFELLHGEYSKMDVRGYRFDGYAGDIFSVEDYYRCSMDLLKTEVRQELFDYGSMIMTKVQDSVPTKYLAGDSVKNSFVSAGCEIEGSVENSILFRGVVVEKGASVKNSIIMQSCVIEAGACVENVIIDRGNRISTQAVIKGSPKETLVLPKSGY